MLKICRARLCLAGCAGLALACFLAEARAVDLAKLEAARMSVSSDELRQHVEVLANDTYEGREAGSRGGRAAGQYLIGKFEQYQLEPVGDRGYVQTFNNGYRNLLGLISGGDPELRDEIVVIGAHYDHVGFGNRENSYGPTGYIHNGADDNASGVSGLMELIEALRQSGLPLRRSVLFALWDGEEKGLLGSRYWLEHPTLPLARVRGSVNLDMIGRLRGDRLEIVGARTGAGLRELLSRSNHAAAMQLDFNWEMRDDSDHYPFYAKNIPVVMLHTGLHDQYHRPTDDVETLNVDGMQHVVRMLVDYVAQLANVDRLPAFRGRSRQESPATQRLAEQPLPPLAGRLGVLMDTAPSDRPGVGLTQAPTNSPAGQAGLRAGDRILTFATQPIGDVESLRRAVLLATNPALATVERPGVEQPLEILIQLKGSPVRVGISWRIDDAEPGCVALSRVVPGSAADQAGLQLNDRILEVNGLEFQSSEEFQTLVSGANAGDSDAPPASQVLRLLVERAGCVREVGLHVPAALVSPAPTNAPRTASRTASR